MRTKKKLILGMLLSIFFAIAAAQEADRNTLAAYQQAAAALTVLKNEAALLPLQGMDTLRIAFLGFGLRPNSELEATLQQYTTVEKLPLPTAGSLADAESWVADQRAHYDLFIAGIHDWDAPAVPDYLYAHFYLQTLLEQAPVLAIVLGGDRALVHLPDLAKAKALVVAPVPHRWSESLAAQVVFGGVGARGRLLKDLSSDFRAGAGQDVAGGLRLGYASPQLVGFQAEKLHEGIRTIVEEGLAAGAYPGAQVLVAKDGQIVYHQTFGHHTYEQVHPVQPDDIYDFASVTKIAASLPAVMRLYGEGKLDIDKTLGDYYPPFKNSNKADLSFRRMLTHTAQLMAWIPFWRATLKGNARYPWDKGWDAWRNNDGHYKWRTFAADSSARYSTSVTENLFLHRRYKQQMLRAIKKSPLNAKPGYVYSDLHFYLYPEIVPRLTGQDFESYLKNTFYRRLGAHTLTFNAWRQYPLSRIVPTERDTFFRGALLHGRVHDEGAGMLNGISGHAGLFGTAVDLAKLMQMYLNGGIYGGERFLSAEVLQEFTDRPYLAEGIHRGIGFDKPFLSYDENSSTVARAASPESFGHSGYTGVFTWADPQYNLLYIFFCNRVYPTRDNRLLITMRLRPRVQQAIYDALEAAK